MQLRYHGTPKSGFRFTGDVFYTVFSTWGWLPCDADPADKATLRLRVELPAALRVYASGARGATEPLPDGQQRVTFTLARPYSTYLFGLAAGRFVERCRVHDGVTLCAAVPPANAAALPALLDALQARGLRSVTLDELIGSEEND